MILVGLICPHAGPLKTRLISGFPRGAKNRKYVICVCVYVCSLLGTVVFSPLAAELCSLCIFLCDVGSKLYGSIINSRLQELIDQTNMLLVNGKLD